MAEDSTPTHVLTKEAVRWAIDALGAQKLHPTFVMYLYLRAQHRAGNLANASASSDELLSLIEMPGNPTKPYYFPLIDRGERIGRPLPSFWRSPNIPGSWSPGSIGRQAPARWMASGGSFVMPEDHVDLALHQLLYDAPISAVAAGAYFLRNAGFRLSGEVGPADVIAAFRLKFDYPDDTDDEFSQLFTSEPPVDPPFSWFEPYTPPAGPTPEEYSEQEGAGDV
jgi:hypothetical protein